MPNFKGWSKSCPRCRGDLVEGQDVSGFYIHCLQCGHYLSEVEGAILRSLKAQQPGLYGHSEEEGK